MVEKSTTMEHSTSSLNHCDCHKHFNIAGYPLHDKNVFNIEVSYELSYEVSNEVPYEFTHQ
jgi:hypothetical protein